MSIMSPYIITRKSIKHKRRFNNLLNPRPNSNKF